MDNASNPLPQPESFLEEAAEYQIEVVTEASDSQGPAPSPTGLTPAQAAAYHEQEQAPAEASELEQESEQAQDDSAFGDDELTL